MRYKTPAAHGMAVKEAAKKSPLDANRAIAGFYLHRLLCRVFSDPDSPFVLKGGQSVLARNLPERFQIPDAWPAVYGKPYAKMARQAKALEAWSFNMEPFVARLGCSRRKRRLGARRQHFP